MLFISLPPESIMKSLIIVFGALLLIIATPFAFSAIDAGRTQEYTQTFAGVTTGAGAYSANVSLSEGAFNDSQLAVKSVSSNESADSPSAADYNSVSKALEVGGLDESSIRTLSVIYLVDSTSLPSGFGTFFGLIRWFWIFAITGLIGGAIYAFFD